MIVNIDQGNLSPMNQGHKHDSLFRPLVPRGWVTLVDVDYDV
jgi:hypothetical protein